MQTHGAIIRPVARLAQLSTYPALCARVRTLTGEGLRPAAIAARLNAEGFRPPKRREQFGRQGITELLRQFGPDTPQSRSRSRTGLGPDEWWLPELARTVPMPDITLYTWVRRGEVQARQQRQLPRRWIIWADAAEVARLRTRHQRPAGEDARQWWAQRVADTTSAPTPKCQ